MSLCSHLTCERCGYTSYQKCNFVRHLKKKIECPPTYDDVSRETLLDKVTQKSTTAAYKCDKCDKHFSNRQGKYQHMQRCTFQIMVRHEDEPLTTLQEKVCHLEKELATIKKKKGDKCHNTTNNNNTACSINTGTVINQNIQINGLGKEDITYITENPKFTTFMNECIRGKVNGLMDYMLKKHFDPNHPENHNVRKLNKKEDFMEVYDGRKWRTQFSDDILEDVFRHMQTDFSNFVDEALTTEGAIKKSWLDNFMEKVGVPLDWDLYSEAGYEYDRDDQSDEQKEDRKLRIYRLACRYVYDNSCCLKRL